MTNNTTAAETLTLHELNLVERLRDANRDIFPSDRNGLIALIERLTSPRAAVPDGWKLVPEKHTLDMSIAFAEAWFSRVRVIDDDDIQDAYSAMLEAAPAAPVAEAEPAPNPLRRRVERLLVELHAEGRLSEGQCAKMLDISSVEWRELVEFLAPGAQAVAEYDGNHVQNHCTECNEHEAECSCAQAVAAPVAEIPEGCTPADAKMLRAANHELAAENDRLRHALGPFARLVSTDRLSWAMVEYQIKDDPEKQTFRHPHMQRAFNRVADLLSEDLCCVCEDLEAECNCGAAQAVAADRAQLTDSEILAKAKDRVYSRPFAEVEYYDFNEKELISFARDLLGGRAAVSPAPVAADGAATKDDVDALTFALGASVMIEGGEKYREALKRMLDRERAAVSPATADQSASDCKIDFGPGATLQPGPRVTFVDGMREAARLIQLWQSMQPAYRQLHSGYNRDASRIIAFWPGRLRECADDAPATSAPCAHDYVRSDRVCTECGEKTATADERAALDMALKLRAAGVAGTAVGDMLHAAAAMIEARASQAAAPARIEALRKGLFNARDALRAIYENRVTSNATIRLWIEDANRVLNGEQAAAPAEAIDRYQAVCAAAYQLAGVVGAPLRFLDALSDAANGEPMSADEALNLLPVGLNEIDEVNRSAAAPAEAREPAETEQSIAANCYHWIAERIGTKDGYSVQEHVDAMCHVIDECADFFHHFVGADEGGDDAAVRIAKNIRALKAGTLQDVSVRADAGEAVLAAVDRAVLAQAADFLEQKHSRLAAVTLRTLLAQGAQGGKGGEA
ncbi:hypothetical protein NFI99_23840 [Burkholderia glumae]|uniref:Uncharacterized protein n=1 Tax=Burkholderia glumae TaxID=337 RepID=A0ABY5BCK6_BURGL|nr:hypothetical protein [Burkholderia glumae]USS44662.1 hypothetical protein NFI99_23840 [Burkholderia glumae]